MAKVFDFLYRNEKSKKYIIFTLIALYGCAILSQSLAFFDGGQHALVLKAIKISRLVMAVLLGIYFVVDFFKKKVKIDWLFFVLLAFFIVTLIVAKSTFLISILFFVYILRQYKFDDFIKYAFWFLFGFFVITICFSMIGIIPDLIHSRGDITRHCLGLNNSTYSQNIFAFIILASIYIYRSKLSWLAILLELCVACFIYFLTNSRASFLLSILLLVVICIVKLFILFNKKTITTKTNKFLTILLSLMPLISFVIFGVLVLMWSGQSDLIIRLNDMLSGRIELTYNAFVDGKLSFFGRDNYWYDSSGYIGIDNAYFNCLFTNGIINTLIVLCMNCWIIFDSVKKKNYWLTFALIVVLIDSFVEQSLLGFQFNLFVFALMNLNQLDNVKSKKGPMAISPKTLKKLENVKLSVIVLCYNGEKYIKKAMENLFNQDVNMEIIVINDGSTDNSLKMLQKYGDKIKIYSNEKQMGISYSRNVGIMKATGDYTANYDIDDLIEPNMFKDMLAKIVETGADICVCDYDEVDEEGKFITNSKYTLNDEMGKDVYRNYLLDKIGPAWWNKIFKASYIKKKRFDETLLIGEDLNFCLGVFSEKPKTVFVDEVLYHYTQRNTSIMHDLSPKHLHFLEIENKETFKKLKQKGEYPEELEAFRVQMIARSIHSISNLKSKYNKKKVYEYLKGFCNKENLNAIIKNKHLSKFTRVECFIMKTFGIKFHLAMMPIYKKIRAMKRKK